MNATIDTVVIGATGYVGGELLRLIAGHPDLRLRAAISGSSAGKPIADLYPALADHYPADEFIGIDDVAARIADGASLAVAHGNGGMLGSRHCAGTVILGRD